MKGHSNHLAQPVVEVDFAELQDGSLVEMVEDPVDQTKSMLAVYSNKIVTYSREVDDHDRILIPRSRADQILRHIRLPQGAEPYGELEELITDVGAFLYRCLDVDPGYLLLMTAWTLSSWLPEKLSVAPYLALVGPPGSGKTTAMRTLSLLCRRSLLTADITSAAFYDVCHCMCPTLLIDETLTAGHPRRLLHLLRTSSSRGFLALRLGKAQLAFGPKVLSWLELPNDAALNSRCIITPMHKATRTDLTSPDDPVVLKFAARLRMRLLQFRFERYNRVLSVPTPPAEQQLSSRALDLYRALALPFGDDPKLCTVFADLIAAQRQFQPGLLSPPQASAVRVLYVWIHAHPIDGGFRLKDLTRGMNSDLASRSEPSGLIERKTGDILTSLGLTNRSRTNPGNYVLWLDRSDRVRIHEKARDYEVDGIPTDPIQNCDICMKPNAAVPNSPVPTPRSEEQVHADELKRARPERRKRRQRRGSRLPARTSNQFGSK